MGVAGSGGAGDGAAGAGADISIGGEVAVGGVAGICALGPAQPVKRKNANRRLATDVPTRFPSGS